MKEHLRVVSRLSDCTNRSKTLQKLTGYHSFKACSYETKRWLARITSPHKVDAAYLEGHLKARIPKALLEGEMPMMRVPAAARACRREAEFLALEPE